MHKTIRPCRTESLALRHSRLSGRYKYGCQRQRQSSAPSPSHRPHISVIFQTLHSCSLTLTIQLFFDHPHHPWQSNSSPFPFPKAQTLRNSSTSAKKSRASILVLFPTTNSKKSLSFCTRSADMLMLPSFISC